MIDGRIGILDLLLASDEAVYERVFLKLMDSDDGQNLLSYHSVDAWLWWRLRGLPPSSYVGQLLLACVALQPSTIVAASNLRYALATQLIAGVAGDRSLLSIPDSYAKDPETWYYLSRTSIGGSSAQLYPQPVVARHVCRALMNCDFIAATRALTLLGPLGRHGTENAEMFAELRRFQAQAMRYVTGLTQTRRHTWLTWEAHMANWVMNSYA